jgi:hypothetical protein
MHSWNSHSCPMPQKLLKVNYLSHQMAITLAEKDFLEKTRKAKQQTPITPG